MNKNRNKGFNAERFYAKIFRDMGFSFCKTSRYANRIYDDAGIDLVETGNFNVQIKAGIQRGLKHDMVLKNIKEKCMKLFPPNHSIHDNINILIHRKFVGRGVKRGKNDDLVTMNFSDFKKLINETNKKS